MRLMALVLGTLLILPLPLNLLAHLLGLHKLDVDVRWVLATAVLGVLLGYAAQLAGILEGKHVKLPGGIEIDDKES